MVLFLGPDRQRCGRWPLPAVQSHLLDDAPYPADGGGALPALPRRLSGRQPDPAFGSGATCAYPHRDLMIRNDTDQPFQLCVGWGSGNWRGNGGP